MNIASQLLPWLNAVLLLGVLFALLMQPLVKNSVKFKSVVLLLLILGMTVSIVGLTPGQWLRTLLGDVSVLMTIVLLNSVSQRLLGYGLFLPSRNILLMGIVLTGIVFYPLSLGLSVFDPYRLGYEPIILTTALIVISVLAWIKGVRDLAIVVLIPLLAFNLGMLESNNLWDYLMDPVLFVYALVQVVNMAMARHRVRIS